jgi:hypothetical protein
VTERDEYRVALALPGPRQLLVTEDSGSARLPRVTVPKWTRPAEEVAAAVEERWHIKSVVIDFFMDKSMLQPSAIVEVLSKERGFRKTGLTAVALHDIGSRDLSDLERTALEGILTGGPGDRGPFSRLGWVDDVQSWIKASVYDHEVEFTGHIRQLNAGGGFALVRLATERGPAYWLKAVGEPNTHEFTLTTNLARTHREFLPPVVCARSDWNAWVMEEVGQPLNSSSPLTECELAITELARMQKHMVDRAQELLVFGCVDQRVENLRSHVDELIEYLEDAMGRQTTTKVPRMTRLRLRELGCVLRDACSRMRQLGIPDSLTHNDINPGNILSDSSRCVFIDWCEASVGNPFLTFEHLVLRFSRGRNSPQAWNERLGTIYKSSWLDVLPEGKIERAFVLTPLLAVLACLYGRGTWLTSPRRHDARFQGYSRSLARHMDRAAQDAQLLEALCH